MERPPKISGITIGMTTEFQRMLVSIRRHKIKKILTQLVQSVNFRPKFNNKRTIFGNALLGMLNSQKLAGFPILTSKINPENFRKISKRLDIL